MLKSYTTDYLEKKHAVFISTSRIKEEQEKDQQSLKNRKKLSNNADFNNDFNHADFNFCAENCLSPQKCFELTKQSKNTIKLTIRSFEEDVNAIF